MATTDRTFDVLAGGKPTIDRDPNDELDYSQLWARWLELSGDDTIDTAVAVNEVDVECFDITHDATTVTIWVRGGTPGVKGSVTVRITTVGDGNPRVKDCTLYFKTREN